jgi:diphthamide synthase subunit DPH2
MDNEKSFKAQTLQELEQNDAISEAKCSKISCIEILDQSNPILNPQNLTKKLSNRYVEVDNSMQDENPIDTPAS